MSDAFPLWYPPDARRLFTAEGMLRRIARTAHWSNASKLLELAASTASVTLAQGVGCSVVAADEDQKVLDALKERITNHALSNLVITRQVSLAALPFGDAEFDGIVALGRVLMPLSTASTKLRKLLAPKGRLVFTYPVKVGRYPAESALKYWETRLGEPLNLPREALLKVEKAGFEPETIETVGESELDDFYRELEKSLAAPADAAGAQKLTEEIALHRQNGGKTGVSYAMLVARRKEPGEKPPASRDGG
jgi:SAM-dependent methyltransferase